MALIDVAIDGLRKHGFELVDKIHDSSGAIGAIVEYDSQKYVVAAKEYSYQGLASFMENLVDMADAGGMQLIFYDDSSSRYTVFDSSHYADVADTSWGDSKMDRTKWLELSRSHGVDVDDYLNGEKPQTLAGSNSTLGQFS